MPINKVSSNAMELVPQIHLIFVKSSFLDEFKTLNIARMTSNILGKHLNFFHEFFECKARRDYAV